MTLPQAAFERAVRRLDGESAREFVADLLQGRGFRTSVEGRVVVATRAAGGSDGATTSIRLQVVDGPLAGRVVDDARLDGLVVTGGSLARRTAALSVGTVGRGGGDGPTLVGPETLYEWFAYAVDTETRTALESRYLGATEPSVFERIWTGLASGAAAATERGERFPAPGRRTIGVVLVALVALVGVVVAGPLVGVGPVGSVGPVLGGPDGGTGEPTPAITSVPVTVTPAPETTTPSASVPDVCPSPPTGAHPASLRPAVRQTASAGGLDGWRLLLTQNISELEFDPNDQKGGVVPEERHIAVFETPGGVHIRLGLDRWESPTRAEAAIERGGPWELGFPWGAYTVWAEWDTGETASDGFARLLLSAVTTPEGVQLRGACVSALAAGSTADGGSGTADTGGTTGTPHVSGQ